MDYPKRVRIAQESFHTVRRELSARPLSKVSGNLTELLCPFFIIACIILTEIGRSYFSFSPLFMYER